MTRGDPAVLFFFFYFCRGQFFCPRRVSLECSILNYDARVYTRVEKGVDVLEDTLNAGEFVSILHDGSLLPLFEVGEVRRKVLWIFTFHQRGADRDYCRES